MITEWDDFPVHQTADPVAFPATSDRNFYDRYFFHGYDVEKRFFFAAALGFYPNRAVVDGAFNVVLDNRQYIVRASCVAHENQRELCVGPFRLHIVQPLKELHISLGDNPWGLSAELRFVSRFPPIEEPRFQRRSGARLWMDYTRMTQHGFWNGWIDVRGVRLDLHPTQVFGARDRSWGIRPVGEPEAGVPSFPLQFFWLWGPFHLPDACVHFAISEHADGQRWHECATIIEGAENAGATPSMRTAKIQHKLRLRPGTRQIEWAEITLFPDGAAELVLEVEPVLHFYMAGLGYGHPEWGHGRYIGDNVVGGDVWDLAAIDPAVPMYFHVQTLSHVRAGSRRGAGVLEQLILGPHAPTGLTGLFDPAT